MVGPVIPDTDVLIDFLRGFDPAVILVQAYAWQIILSSIVVAELYAGVHKIMNGRAVRHPASILPYQWFPALHQPPDIVPVASPDQNREESRPHGEHG